MCYEAAGDQYVGRAAAGLPIIDAMIAILPPFFKECPEYVDTAIKLCFPTVPQEMQRVVEFALAFIVYQYDFLKSTLHAQHIVFGTSLFHQPHLVRKLCDLVECRLPKASDPMSATGIPPHVLHLTTLQAMQDELNKVVPAIDGIVPAVVGGVVV
jgi:hypothetical protein